MLVGVSWPSDADSCVLVSRSLRGAPRVNVSQSQQGVQMVASHLETQRFLFPRPCRSRRKLHLMLPGEGLVHDSFPDDAIECLSKAFAVSRLSGVESVSLFVQIAEQVERLYADVGTLDPALQEAPEVLQT